MAIYVTDHARRRASERFPGSFKGARIDKEIREAMKAGRISATKPEGFRGRSRPECLYAWNDHRAYALKTAGGQFIVVTTVARI